MANKTYIEHNNKQYHIKELTTEMWSDIMKYKNILDEVDMYVKTISIMTGLSSDEIKESDADEINKVGEELYKYLNQESKEVYYNITHNEVEYTLVDLDNISFGQFVDIDTFLGKEESYRVANLNEVAAYLYTEKDTKYGQTNFKKKIESFKTLPFKYVEGAIFFLWSTERLLQGLSQLYSTNKLKWEMMRLKVALANFGDTIFGLANSQTTILGKLILLLLSPLFFVLTICLTLWTYIKSKIKR